MLLNTLKSKKFKKTQKTSLSLGFMVFLDGFYWPGFLMPNLGLTQLTYKEFNCV